MKMSIKTCSKLAKGFLIPFAIILATTGCNIAQLHGINNLTNGIEITGYLDNNLWTNAALIMDNFTMGFNIVYVFASILTQFMCFLTVSGNREGYYILAGIMSIFPSVISLAYGQLVNPTIPAPVFYKVAEGYIPIDGVELSYLRDEESTVRIIMAGDTFPGFRLGDEQILPAGPWILPYSFTIISRYSESIYAIAGQFRMAYMILLGFGIALTAISLVTAFYKYQRARNIAPATMEETAVMLRPPGDIVINTVEMQTESARSISTIEPVIQLRSRHTSNASEN
jgi:hypothetical protein